MFLKIVDCQLQVCEPSSTYPNIQASKKNVAHCNFLFFVSQVFDSVEKNSGEYSVTTIAISLNTKDWQYMRHCIT